MSDEVDYKKLYEQLQASTEAEKCTLKQEIAELRARQGISGAPKDSKSKVESDRFAITAFSQPFCGTEAVSALEAHFNDCISLLNGGDKYYPYISMVQSSGTGKTRLVFEYAQQKKVPLFYACFREISESGYPFGTLFRGQMLDATKDDDSAHAFVHSLIETIKSLDSEDLSQFFGDQITSKENNSSSQTKQSLFALFWDQVLRETHLLIQQSLEKKATKLTAITVVQTGASADVAAEVEADVSVSIETLAPAGAASVFTFSKFERIQHLVVFDEARALLTICDQNYETSYFIHLRRAILNFELDLRAAGIMIVFIDTTSKVANFSPPVSQMSSSWRGDGYNLLPPFHNVANAANLYWAKCPDQNVDDSTVFLFGRPLWWTKFFNDGCNFQDLFTLAKQKLLCSKEAFSNSNIHQPSASAAIICCLLDLTITPGTKLSVNLISSHMAYCVGISKNREHSRCTYLNEPILHAAALALLHENAEQILQNAREHFALADLGWSGEFAAQIICLLAAKKPAFLSSDHNASQCDQDLELFLYNLMPFSKELDTSNSGDIVRAPQFTSVADKADWKRNRIKMCFDQKMKSPQVRILRFVRLQRPPLIADLPMYYLFGLVFVCQRNNKATDLGIVVRYKVDGDDDYHYTVLLIQVKNEARSFSLKACKKLLKKMKFQDTFKSEPPHPTMPFGPTARTFAVDEDYSVNKKATCNSLPLLRLLMKTRLSDAETINATNVYYSFFSNNEGEFLGTVRGFQKTELLTDGVIRALEHIVADNEKFFQHELPNNISFTNFRASYDLLQANSIAAHDSSVAASNASHSHPNSKWKSQLIATIHELNAGYARDLNLVQQISQSGTSLLNAFQYYRSRQLNTLSCKADMKRLLLFVKKQVLDDEATRLSTAAFSQEIVKLAASAIDANETSLHKQLETFFRELEKEHVDSISAEPAAAAEPPAGLGKRKNQGESSTATISDAKKAKIS